MEDETSRQTSLYSTSDATRHTGSMLPLNVNLQSLDMIPSVEVESRRTFDSSNELEEEILSLLPATKTSNLSDAVDVVADAADTSTIVSSNSMRSRLSSDPVIGPRNFSGVMARAFAEWPLDRPLPCYRPEDNWDITAVQFTPARTGFLYLKPYKTGSSTTSGVNLRIARNVARRRQRNNRTETAVAAVAANNFSICKTRFDHGPDYSPGHTLFRNRIPTKSFLWTILRDPTTRATSHFFHFEVSRRKNEPTDANFIALLRQTHKMQDYYYKALYTKDLFDRSKHDHVQAANHILRNYNFIGITERLDESLVVLMMQLRLKIADILYLSAKGRGGYDDAGGPSYMCTYIWPSFISPGMKKHFASDEWQDMIKNDMLLYNAANRSLDMTIDALGRKAFNQNLEKFHEAQELAKVQCLPTAAFPCDKAGYLNKYTDCIWRDSGCGKTCLDQVADDLGLW